MPAGDVWGNAWGNSWNGYWRQAGITLPPPAAPVHRPGGWWPHQEVIRFRHSVEQAERSRHQSEAKRRKADERLSAALEKIYRSVVLHEPELAETIASAALPANTPRPTEYAPNGPDWKAARLDVSEMQRLLGELEAYRQRTFTDSLAAWEAADEDDVETILLLT